MSAAHGVEKNSAASRLQSRLGMRRSFSDVIRGGKAERADREARQSQLCNGDGHAADPPLLDRLSESRISHEQVRKVLADWFASTAPQFADCAAELALASYPWLDSATSPEEIQNLVAELTPMANLQHPDPREVAADRLLRITEMFRSNRDLVAIVRPEVSDYEVAASSLIVAIDRAPRRVDRIVFEVVADPLNMYVYDLPGHSDLSVVPTQETRVGRPNIAAVSALVRSIVASGSTDLGPNLGFESVGLSMMEILEVTGYRSLLVRLEDFIATTDERMLYILMRRTFAPDNPMTLETLGIRWGLTRERVRQIEVSATKHLKKFGDIGVAGSVLDPIKSIIFVEERLELASAFLASLSDNRAVVSKAIANLSGPWINESGWIHHASLDLDLNAAKTEIKASADEYGIIPTGSLIALNTFFTTQHDRDSYLRATETLRNIDGTWTLRDSLRTRIAIALRKIGRCATKEEIRDHGDFPPDINLGSTLSALPNIVRAGQHTWGFVEWVDDVYEGIPAEIMQRIDQNGGSVSLALLLEELPRQFGVQESSVYTNVQTPAFVVENGYVRTANVQDFAANAPDKWGDAVFEDGLWGQRIQLAERYFQGYSIKVRFDIAYANGVEPGCHVHVPVDETRNEASVIWRQTDAAGCIDVGRVAVSLKDLGMSDGEAVIVFPTPTKVRIVRDSTSAAVDDSVETGIDDISDPLFDLLDRK